MGGENKTFTFPDKWPPGSSLRPFYLPVEIIEEGEQVKAQLTPGLLLAVVEDVGVHHAHGVVHDLGAVSRPVEKPGTEEEAWLASAKAPTEACETCVVGLHLHRW